MRTLATGIHLLDADDQRVMPWKNGGGITRELAVHPPGAGMNDKPFLWRVSIAEVASDGPFSAFPGYERSIMLLAGKGMELGIGAAPPQYVTEVCRPLRFSGDEATRCRLLDGPVRDFNVMSVRDAIEHRCDVIHDGAVEALWQNDIALFCYCVRGNLIVKSRATEEWNLDHGQSIWFASTAPDSTLRILFAPNSPNTLAILVSLHPVS